MNTRYSCPILLTLVATASAQNDYFYDIGSTDNSWGGGNAHTCWIQAYDAQGGADVIDEILTSYGTPAFPGFMADGLPAQIMLYDDPNNDGDPTDAVLLWSTSALTANSDTDILNSYTVTPAQPVTGKFFVAAVVDHKGTPYWPAPRDTSQASAGRAWMCRNNNVNIPFDIVNLAANDFPPFDMDGFTGGASVFRIQANGQDTGPIGMTTTDCPALPNSNGQVPNVSLVGTGLAGDDVSAIIFNGPAGEFGYFISGPNGGIIPAGCGVVCIGGPQYRYSSSSLGHVYQFDAVGNAGPITLQTDGSFAPVPAVMMGETRRFEGWYRDMGCTLPNQAFNFTDVVSVTFN